MHREWLVSGAGAGPAGEGRVTSPDGRPARQTEARWPGAGPALVWGAGAMGGTLGAHLARAGRDVVLVDRWAEHVHAIRADGLRVTGPLAEFLVRPAALGPEEVTGSYRLVFLCVKAHHTAAAARQLAPHLAPDGVVVSVQNGLNELVIAREVGEARTLGCFVNFGADVVAPGVVHWGGRGAVLVGELDGHASQRGRHVLDALRLLEPDASLTDNILGYLWGKLAYGALLFATALTDATIADALAAPEHRSALVTLAREVTRVARALGVRLEGFDGFDPHAFTDEAPAGAAASSLDELVAFNRRSAKARSGVWRDLAVHRRRTEVDAQIGVVLELGEAAGVPTPLVARLVDLIHDVEEGRRPQAWETLAALDPTPGGAVRAFEREGSS